MKRILLINISGEINICVFTSTLFTNVNNEFVGLIIKGN